MEEKENEKKEKEFFGVLSNNEIESRIDIINFECDGKEISIEDQIQPCSVDLRLDNIFWKNKKHTTFDFRDPIIKLDPIYHWDNITISDNEIIKLKPGEMLMGRTLEVFSVPDDCYGRIEGKNSNSRLGLGVSVNCSFINPSWRGHMPLQLINNTKSIMKIIPFMPICQVLFIKLSSTPTLKYGTKAAKSTYINEIKNRPIDIGGPSKWYETAFFETLSTQNATDPLEKFLNLFIKTELKDIRIYERFKVFYDKKKLSDISNFNTLISDFAKREDMLRKKDLFFKKTLPAIFLILSGGVGLLLKLTEKINKTDVGLKICIVFFVLSLIIRLLPEIKPFFDTPRTEYLTKDIIKKHLK
jgi:dCTP deaminase